MRLFKMPIRFLVGERPAGAERGVLDVSILGAGERAGKIGRFGGEREEVGLSEEKVLGEGDGGAVVSEK